MSSFLKMKYNRHSRAESPCGQVSKPAASLPSHPSHTRVSLVLTCSPPLNYFVPEMFKKLHLPLELDLKAFQGQETETELTCVN